MRLIQRMEAFCEGAVRVIGGGILLLLLGGNLIFSSYVDYQTERVTIERNNWKTLLLMLLIAGGLLLLLRLASHVREELLFLLLSGVTLAAGIFLICSTDGQLRSDPLYVYETAAALASGDMASLTAGGYLHYFPHQLGLVCYDRLLLLFTDNTKMIFVCNLLEAVGINFWLWRLGDLLFEKNKVVNRNVILLSFLFLPQLFFVLFAYGLIPGLFCLTAAFYFAAVYRKKGGKGAFAGVIVFSCLAVFLKKNFVIGVIALVLWLALRAVQGGSRRLFLAALCLLPCCLGTTEAAKAITARQSGYDMGKGVPAALYIGMGINTQNEMLGPGWFDGSNWSYFTMSGEDSGEADRLAGELLQVYFAQMKEEPLHTAKFFVKKIVSAWCEPLCQSLWSGPQEEYGQHMYNAFAVSLYNGGAAEQWVYCYMKGYMLVLLTLGLRFVLWDWKKGDGLLLLLYLTGGFLFHLFWETKSQYVYPYLFSLIPLCALGAENLPGKQNGAKGKDRIYEKTAE